MAKAHGLKSLRPNDPYRYTAATVVAVRTREVFDRAAGVLDTSDIERVHAMRVATRRLRAALEVFGPCFPGRAHRKALRDVKTLADALGGRRDRDVQIVALAQLAEQLPDADHRAAKTLIAELREEQRSANVRLARALKRAKKTKLRRRLERLAP